MNQQRTRKQWVNRVLYHLKRWSVWLRRAKYSRGFGVQSPSAYQFIRYVLTEHYPYYAYATLRHRHRNEGHAVQKRGRLFFRLANYLQAKQWFHAGDKADVYADYVNEGCSKTQFLPLDDAQLPTTFSVASLPLTQHHLAVCQALIKRSQAQSMLILLDIHARREALAAWKKLIQQPQVVRSYDLYDCGIVLFDASKPKHHYMINF